MTFYSQEAYTEDKKQQPAIMVRLNHLSRPRFVLRAGGREEGYAWRRKASFSSRSAPVGERKMSAGDQLGGAKDKPADTVTIKL